jgi:hypothetical protein
MESRSAGRTGGLVVSAMAALPFVSIWVGSLLTADDPVTFRLALAMAIWLAVFGTPFVAAARLLWGTWWRRAGARLSALDGPGLLLAAATVTLPAGRRHWGPAMAAELTQVQGGPARWRFAAGCARTALFPPHGGRAAVAVAGGLAVAATAAAALVTAAALPAGRVFGPAFVGLVGGLATLAVARSRRPGGGGPGPVIAGLALAGVAGTLGYTTWYLAEYPTTHHGFPPTSSATLSPGTAVALAVLLAGCLWLALRPPRWLRPDRLARRFGVAMTLVVVAGFLVTSRLGLSGVDLADAGLMSYLLFIPPLVVLAGSAVAAVAGRSLRSGLWACAWTTVLSVLLVMVAWLAEAPHWHRELGGLLLDADGGVGVGANLGDAVWWTLVVLVLWTMPLGVLGAAAGNALARRYGP